MEQVGIDNYYLLTSEGTRINTLLETLWLLSILWLPKVSSDKKGLLSLSLFVPYFVLNEDHFTALDLVESYYLTIPLALQRHSHIQEVIIKN